MVSKVFSVYDSKAGIYMPPFLLRSKGDAIRGFTDLCNDEKTAVCRHPSDFTLFELGEFDDDKGEFVMYNAKISLGVAIEFKRAPLEEAPLLRALEKKGE